MTASSRHARYVPSVPDAYGGGFAGEGASSADAFDVGRPTDADSVRDPQGATAFVAGVEDAPNVPPTTLRRTPADAPAVPSSAPDAGRGGRLVRAPVASRPYDTAAYVTPPARAASPRTSRSHGVAAAVLAAVAVVLRLVAAALCALVLANAVAAGPARPLVLDATAVVDDALPSLVAGTLTLPTILGGSFRGDVAVSAIILFVADWLCTRGAAVLRER